MSEQLPKLPDGSSFFVADVMSKEEAMKLPVEKRPICFRISSEMYHATFESIGEASRCWKPRPDTEVFSSEEASQVAVNLCFKIAEEVERRIDRLHRILTRILSKEGLHTPAVNISVTMNEVNGTKTTEELIEFLEREMNQ